MSNTSRMQILRNELQRDGAYLLPLRLFIGLGWLRAGLEKMLNPEWLAGTALSQFFQTQISQDLVVFPLYQALIGNLFEPNIVLLSWLIVAGELCVGAAVLLGAFSSLALLLGLFMNINFLLAGVVNPSAFYIVIQTVLFIANTGAILGLDRWIARYIPYNFIIKA